MKKSMKSKMFGSEERLGIDFDGGWFSKSESDIPEDELEFRSMSEEKIFVWSKFSFDEAGKH